MPRVKVPLPISVKPKAPVTLPVEVMPFVALIVTAEPKVMSPLTLPVAPLLPLINAPVELIPSPYSVNALVIVWPLRLITTPPLLVSVTAPVPNGWKLEPALRVPPLTVVPPL